MYYLFKKMCTAFSYHSLLGSKTVVFSFLLVFSCSRSISYSFRTNKQIGYFKFTEFHFYIKPSFHELNYSFFIYLFLLSL